MFTDSECTFVFHRSGHESWLLLVSGHVSFEDATAKEGISYRQKLRGWEYLRYGISSRAGGDPIEIRTRHLQDVSQKTVNLSVKRLGMLRFVMAFNAVHMVICAGKTACWEASQFLSSIKDNETDGACIT
jgi:hypothetical protein